MANTSNMTAKNLIIAIVALAVLCFGIALAVEVTLFSSPFDLSSEVVAPTPNAAATEHETTAPSSMMAERILSPASSNASTEPQEGSRMLPRSAKRTDSIQQIWSSQEPDWDIRYEWHGYNKCHRSDSSYNFFTIAYANGTLATDADGRNALFYIDTPWKMNYQVRLRAAILDDAKPFDGTKKDQECVQGPCFSEVVPGVRYHKHFMVLKHVEHPQLLRGRFANTLCGYSDSVRKVSKNNIRLATIGYYSYGATIPPAILDFVEARIMTTYPTVETTLVYILTVVLVLCLIVVGVRLWTLLHLAQLLDFISPQICGQLRQWRRDMWKGIITAPGKVWNMMNKGCNKMSNGWNTMFRRCSETGGAQENGQGHGQLDVELPDYVSTRPPSYKTNDSRLGSAMV